MSGLDKTRFLSKSRVSCVVLVECAPFVMKCKFEEGDRVLEYGHEQHQSPERTRQTDKEKLSILCSVKLDGENKCDENKLKLVSHAYMMLYSAVRDSE